MIEVSISIKCILSLLLRSELGTDSLNKKADVVRITSRSHRCIRARVSLSLSHFSKKKKQKLLCSLPYTGMSRLVRVFCVHARPNDAIRIMCGNRKPNTTHEVFEKDDNVSKSRQIWSEGEKWADSIYYITRPTHDNWHDSIGCDRFYCYLEYFTSYEFSVFECEFRSKRNCMLGCRWVWSRLSTFSFNKCAASRIDYACHKQENIGGSDMQTADLILPLWVWVYCGRKHSSRRARWLSFNWETIVFDWTEFRRSITNAFKVGND